MAGIWKVTGGKCAPIPSVAISFVAFVVTSDEDDTNRAAREIVAEHIWDLVDWCDDDLNLLHAEPIGMVLGNEDGDGYVLEKGILSLSFLTKTSPTPVQEPPQLWPG